MYTSKKYEAKIPVPFFRMGRTKSKNTKPGMSFLCSGRHRRSDRGHSNSKPTNIPDFYSPIQHSVLKATAFSNFVF